MIEAWSPVPRSSASGIGAGKVAYSDLSVMISLEKSSPLLNLALAEGKHFAALRAHDPAPVEVRKSGDDKRQDYLTITLEEVMVLELPEARQRQRPPQHQLREDRAPHRDGQDDGRRGHGDRGDRRRSPPHGRS